MALKDSQYTHYHIHQPEDVTFNPDVICSRALGIAPGHVMTEDEPNADSLYINPDIDYVDTTPTPTVIAPSFGVWFGTIASNDTIRSARKFGGATGNNGLNHTYYVATDTLPTHPTSLQDQSAASEPVQPVAAEGSQAVQSEVK